MLTLCRQSMALRSSRLWQLSAQVRLLPQPTLKCPSRFTWNNPLYEVYSRQMKRAAAEAPLRLGSSLSASRHLDYRSDLCSVVSYSWQCPWMRTTRPSTLSRSCIQKLTTGQHLSLR